MPLERGGLALSDGGGGVDGGCVNGSGGEHNGTSGGGDLDHIEDR